jgi:hypothetical protein
VAKDKRNLLDELKDRVQDVLEEVDRMLRPEQHKPARVPIPVRSRPEQQYPPNNNNDPYRR